MICVATLVLKSNTECVDKPADSQSLAHWGTKRSTLENAHNCGTQGFQYWRGVLFVCFAANHDEVIVVPSPYEVNQQSSNFAMQTRFWATLHFICQSQNEGLGYVLELQRGFWLWDQDAGCWIMLQQWWFTLTKRLLMGRGLNLIWRNRLFWCSLTFGLELLNLKWIWAIETHQSCPGLFETKLLTGRGFEFKESHRKVVLSLVNCHPLLPPHEGCSLTLELELFNMTGTPWANQPAPSCHAWAF